MSLFLLIDKWELQRITQISVHTWKDYRLAGRIHEGIHWFKRGNKVVYNLPMIQDWMANRDDPASHDRAIDLYLASLPSNQAKSLRRAG